MRRSRFVMVMTMSSGLMMATLSSLTHVGLRKPIFQSQRLDVFEVPCVMCSQDGITGNSRSGDQRIDFSCRASLLLERQAQAAVRLCACSIEIGDIDHLKELFESLDIFCSTRRGPRSV